MVPPDGSGFPLVRVPGGRVTRMQSPSRQMRLLLLFWLVSLFSSFGKHSIEWKLLADHC